ncbi:MAG: hypothetical protein LBN38_05380 [Verrucomicrobiota bacterium]|jgi:hypothetical protein|nr:hypothetical protein [Verrucomicrobiota bacterium]
MSRLTWCFVALGLVLTLKMVGAFPPLPPAGIFEGHRRYGEGNPHVFAVLVSQDYRGFGMERGSWAAAYEIAYGGHSKRVVNISEPFSVGAGVEFYFRGGDGWGGRIRDSRAGMRNLLETGPTEWVWIGNVNQGPTHDAMSTKDDLLVRIESWPQNADVAEGGIYTSTKGLIWAETALAHVGSLGVNDLWRANPGAFPWSQEAPYVYYLANGWSVLRENRFGLDDRAKTNTNSAWSALGATDGDNDGNPDAEEYPVEDGDSGL